MEKLVEDLVSGDQIVQSDLRWDRVHGVDPEQEPGMVFVTTDSAPSIRYARGTVVTVA
ncbi:hypothetical protein [Amycolatopsis sp. NPDC004079]|uniref:hypothetical protein n=1 Tax=Amycolatopsis sp. NPDC004079 TaxID=3154549 RepID=UPI0033B703BB